MFFIEGEGVAVGKRSSRALAEGSSQQVSLQNYVGRRIRFRSDGKYLYVKPAQ